jgi:hypothetical protein
MLLVIMICVSVEGTCGDENDDDKVDDDDDDDDDEDDENDDDDNDDDDEDDDDDGGKVPADVLSGDNCEWKKTNEAKHASLLM